MRARPAPHDNRDARPHDRDRGFSLVETVASTGIIGVVLLAFVSFMMQSGEANRNIQVDRLAYQVLNHQVETLQSMRWDDVMLGDGNSSAICPLPENRFSTRPILSVPERIDLDGRWFEVTRTIVWQQSGTPVTCVSLTNPNQNDKDQIKRVQITVKYYPGEVEYGSTNTAEAKYITTTIYLSRWLEKRDDTFPW